MSELAAKRHPIDLDEFDRRLRAPAAPQRQGGGEDPLTELARLVNSSPDPFAPIFAAGRPDSRAPAGKAAQPGGQGSAPSASARPVQAPARREEPGLRGGFDGVDHRQGAGQSASSAGYVAEPAWTEDAYASAPPVASGRSGRAAFLMSAALAVVFAGVAGALAMRNHVSSFGSPRTILADARPFKVKPPSEPAKDQIENSTTLLNKGDTDKVRPAHIVNTEEEPVDLALATSTKDASTASGNAPVDPVFSAFPAPRKVKTVLVRPDGSLISPGDSAGADASEAADASASGSTSSNSPESGQAAEPATAAPSSDQSAAAEPNSAGFASVVDRAASAANAQAADAPPAAPRAPAAPPPARQTPARVQTADLSSEAPKTPTSAARQSPAQSAGWAVQLAAPATEREAHAEMARLGRKFSRDLGGRKLTSFAAKSSGRSVWRVRVAGLSKSDAASLCDKIRGGGGACFVAHN